MISGDFPTIKCARINHALPNPSFGVFFAGEPILCRYMLVGTISFSYTCTVCLEWDCDIDIWASQLR